MLEDSGDRGCRWGDQVTFSFHLCCTEEENEAGNSEKVGEYCSEDTIFSMEEDAQE